MSISHEKIYHDFCDNTKTTFYLNLSAILLIFVFVLGPFNTNWFTQVVCRVLIVAILSYSLYITLYSSNTLLEIENMFTNPNLAIIRNNYILNMVFSVVIMSAVLYLVYGFIY